MDNSKGSGTLRKIDLNEKSFTANGIEYFIESGLSKERFLMYQKLQIELPFQAGFAGVIKALRDARVTLNKCEFVSSAVIIDNALTGLSVNGERRIPALEMAALFINQKDEDRRIINQDIVDKKINDWEAEGLDMIPFFQLATSSIAGFKEIYNEIIQSSLEEVIKV